MVGIIKRALVGVLMMFFCMPAVSGPVLAAQFEDIPFKGIVTMIDLGAQKCIPCKMMAPIIKKLKKVYEGKAAIIFIDVWENRDQAKRFGIRAIPTQIFFDKNTQEVYRHVGFMSETLMVQQLKKMGVDSAQKNKPDSL